MSIIEPGPDIWNNWYCQYCNIDSAGNHEFTCPNHPMNFFTPQYSFSSVVWKIEDSGKVDELELRVKFLETLNGNQAETIGKLQKELREVNEENRLLKRDGDTGWKSMNYYYNKSKKLERQLKDAAQAYLRLERVAKAWRRGLVDLSFGCWKQQGDNLYRVRAWQVEQSEETLRDFKSLVDWQKKRLR